MKTQLKLKYNGFFFILAELPATGSVQCNHTKQIIVSVYADTSIPIEEHGTGKMLYYYEYTSHDADSLEKIRFDVLMSIFHFNDSFIGQKLLEHSEISIQNHGHIHIYNNQHYKLSVNQNKQQFSLIHVNVHEQHIYPYDIVTDTPSVDENHEMMYQANQLYKSLIQD